MSKELTDTIMTFYNECSKERSRPQKLEWYEDKRHVVIAYHDGLPNGNKDNPDLTISIAEQSKNDAYSEQMQFQEYSIKGNFSGELTSFFIKNNALKNNIVHLDKSSPFSKYYQDMYNEIKKEIINKINEMK
jgi:hypothetical protein